jgi:CBS domain-containing protein
MAGGTGIHLASAGRDAASLNMNISDSVRLVLNQKGSQVHSTTPEATVFDAIQVMAEQNIGALMVLSEGRLAGIFSERDYTRKVALAGRSSRETLVRELLSSPVHCVTPDHSVEDCMRLMLTHRVRHLPVIEGERLVGVVSIGDLVNWTILAQSQEIDQLKTFITGQYPG